MTADNDDALFTGLSAFPLTPLHGEDLDEEAYIGLIERLVLAGVDSITALGSTGSYVYLDPEERARVAQLSVDSALDIPVFVGIGALRTRVVLANARTAGAAGAKGLLLAPVGYQPLTDAAVFALFRTVAVDAARPSPVDAHPRTTHLTFCTDLYARLAELRAVASIKMPGAALSPTGWAERTGAIRDAAGHEVTTGISGADFGAERLTA